MAGNLQITDATVADLCHTLKTPWGSQGINMAAGWPVDMICQVWANVGKKSLEAVEMAWFSTGRAQRNKVRKRFQLKQNLLLDFAANSSS